MTSATEAKKQLKVKDIAFTAYSVSDMGCARQFYEGTLGLTPTETFGEMWQEYTIGNGTLAIIAAGDQAPEFFRGRGYALALEIEDLDAAFDVIRQNHVKVLQEPQDFPGCRMFVISDPDDNAITFHQIKAR